MIAGVNMSGQLNALYPQYNATKVKPIKRSNAVDSNESLQAVNKKEKEQSSVAVSAELKNAQNISYTSNPYDQTRKSAENTLLVGQNFDIAV